MGLCCHLDYYRNIDLRKKDIMSIVKANEIAIKLIQGETIPRKDFENSETAETVKMLLEQKVLELKKVIKQLKEF